MPKLIVFDLDNTLAKSKTAIDEEMSELFSKLLKNTLVAVISGGSFKQFEKELLYQLSLSSNLLNLHIFPTDGTAYFSWDDKSGKWQKIYQESLSEKEKIKIKDAFSQTLTELSFDTKSVVGELIEDRDSAITFSALGQDAPLELKEKWDIDSNKRKKIVEKLGEKLRDFDIHIAGTTSIDITKKGMDKAYGIRKMVEYIKVGIEDMVFIGDSLFELGNDHPVISTGVKTISVKDPEETKTIIKDLIKKS